MRQRRSNVDVDVAVDRRPVACKIDDAVIVGARAQLARVFRRRTGDEDALPRSHHSFAVAAVLRVEERLQPRKAGELDVLRNLIGEIRGRRARSRTVREAERAVERHVLDEAQRALEIVVGLAGKADDDVRRERQIASRSLRTIDLYSSTV